MSQPKHAGPRRRRPMRGMATFSAFAVVAVLSLPMAASAYAAEGDVVDPTTVPAVDVIQDAPAAPADEAPSDVAPDTTPNPDPAPAPEPAPEQADEPEVPAPDALPQSEPMLAMSMAPQSRPDPKVWVCKVVGPFGDYQLKAGKQPIHVSVNSTDAQEAFSDSHPSFVVDSDNRALCEAAFLSEWHTWSTEPKPGVTNPVDSGDVTFPQPYLGPGKVAPACGEWVQQDLYTGMRAEIDAVLADGQLTMTNGVPEDAAIVSDWEFVYGGDCPPTYYLESSHVEECGTVEISLRNVSPWIYPMSVEIDGVHSYGPVVDNRGAAPDDQTATRTITFPEDSGTHTVRYRVQAGTESDLYAGLPVGEWVELVIETNCAPDVVQCEEVIDGGTVTNLDMDGWTVTNGTWTEDGLRLDSDGWVDATVSKSTSFNLSAARDIALDMDVSAAGNYGMGIVFSTSEGDFHWEELYSDEFWSNEPVLPPTGGGQGGPYSGSLEDAMVTVGDLEVTSVTIVFSSATPNSAMLNSATLNCTNVKFEYERPPAPPTKDPTFTEWSDGDWDCGDTVVMQTRTRTDYAAPVWDPETMSWVEDKVGTTTTETQPRTLEPEEIKEWQTADPEAACYNRPEPPDPEKGSRTSVTCTAAIDYTWDITPVWNEETGKYDMVKGPETASSPRTPTAEELKTVTCPTPPPNTPPAADTDWSGHGSLTSPTWMSTWLAAGVASMVLAGAGMSLLISRLRRRGIQ